MIYEQLTLRRLCRWSPPGPFHLRPPVSVLGCSTCSSVSGLSGAGRPVSTVTVGGAEPVLAPRASPGSRAHDQDGGSPATGWARAPQRVGDVWEGRCSLFRLRFAGKRASGLMSCCSAGKFVDGCRAVCGSVLSGRVGSRLDTGSLWPTAQLVAVQAARSPRINFQDQLQHPAEICQEQTVRQDSSLS